MSLWLLSLYETFQGFKVTKYWEKTSNKFDYSHVSHKHNITYKIKNSFVRSVRTKARYNKTGINFMIWYFDIRRKLSVIRWYTWLSVWLRIGSNPSDIKRFRSYTRNSLKLAGVKFLQLPSPHFLIRFSSGAHLALQGWSMLWKIIQLG